MEASSWWRIQVGKRKGVNNNHDFLYRSVLIGRHIRSIVRNVAARQSVTGSERVDAVERPVVDGGLIMKISS